MKPGMQNSMIHADRPNAQTSVSDSDTGLPEKFLVHIYPIDTCLQARKY